MELVELIRGAQDAMDHGDYRLAIAQCGHILDSYPACLTAHRMLGEAHLEQGQIDSAIEHFERTLTIDPLNVVARLGLGVASEERKEMSRAYTEYLHAWEINPALDQVRDELVRLRGLLGGGERLHPTRAGLAGIFGRSGQFGRAAAEWRAVLLVEPESRRARTSLAEVLWRGGDDLAAAAVAREVVSAMPDNARALALLAEIELRRGASSASELISRYQDVDPAAEIVTIFSEWRDDLDLSSLRRISAPLAEFNLAAAAVNGNGYGGLTVGAGSNGTNGLASGHFAAPDLWDTLVRDLKPGSAETSPLGSDVLPFSWVDEGETAAAMAPPPAEAFSLDAVMDPRSVRSMETAIPAVDMEPMQITNGHSLESQLAAMSSPAMQADPQPRSVPELVGAAAPLGASDLPPIPAAPSIPDRPNAAGNPFVTADGQVDLTVGWDDLDRQLREATPSFDNSSEFDELTASLGVDGIMPFEVGESPFDTDAWAPFGDDDLGVPSNGAPVAAAPTIASPPAAAAPDFEPEPEAAEEMLIADSPVTLDDAVDLQAEAEQAAWGLDDDLLSAIPAPQSSGYTDLLRHIDKDLPQDFDFGDDIDPFANPDSAGSPLAFEDLLAVTSQDGTAPLGAAHAFIEGIEEIPIGAAEFVVPEASDHIADMVGSVPELADLAMDEPGLAGEPESFDDLLVGLGGVQPFSLDDAFEAEVPFAPADIVDFSDINDAPFDPATLPRVTGAPIMELPFADDREPAASEPALAAAFHVEPVPTVAEPLATVEMVSAPAEPVVLADVPAKKGTGGLGLSPSSVVWPTFVNQSSELMDRGYDNGNLFERLRASKQTAMSAGLLTVDRALATPPALPIPVEPRGEQLLSGAMPPIAPEPRRRPQVNKLTEAERIDLMAMRIRLIEDEDSAGEIVKQLEGAVARGLNDPLALRVLGEAYLKVGRMEQAAAQFRQAMLARSRAR